jgi:hypothetical protein
MGASMEDYDLDNYVYSTCLVTVDGGGNPVQCTGDCAPGDWDNNYPDPEPHSIDDPGYFGTAYLGDNY